MSAPNSNGDSEKYTFKVPTSFFTNDANKGCEILVYEADYNVLGTLFVSAFTPTFNYETNKISFQANTNAMTGIEITSES